MKVTVKVLKSFDGFEGELIEVIRREAVQVRRSQKRGMRGTPERGVYRISYKGKIYRTFPLHQGYADVGIDGLCITLEPAR